MGRWGKGIYDSDQAQEYHSTVTDLLSREIAYWMIPEYVFQNSFWLAQVLAVIEVMLIFEYQDIGSSNTYIAEVARVKHWREAFFSVWDGDWHENSNFYPYDTPNYRQQYRPGVVALFDCLESLAEFWETIGNGTRTEVMRMPPDYPLPYFSLVHWKYDNRQGVRVNRFTEKLLDHLLKDIVYWLSPEIRADSLSDDVDELWVAVDNLGFLCEIYEQTPRVSEQTVRTWRSIADQISLESLGDDYWNDSNPFYHNAMHAFDRLESVARKHPPSW